MVFYFVLFFLIINFLDTYTSVTRHMTPEINVGLPDYGYVSYLDSSIGGRTANSQALRNIDLDISAPRSILKNKQVYY